MSPLLIGFVRILNINNLTTRFHRIDKQLQEIIKGSFVAFALKVLSAGLLFGFNILIARLLGAEGAGVYFLALSIVTLSATIANFGLNNSVLRFTAAMSSEKNWAAVKGVVDKSLWLTFLGSLAITGGLIATAPWLSSSIFMMPKLAEPLQWMALAILPICVSQLYSHALKGVKLLKAGLMVESISIPLVSCGLVIVLTIQYGIEGAVWTYVIAATISLSIAILCWHGYRKRFLPKHGLFAWKKLTASSWPLFWTSIMTIIANQASTYFLGIWGTAEEIGIFNVALRCANLISFVLISVNQVVAPKFAALYQEGNIEKIENIAQKSTFLMIIISTPLLILMLIYPEYLLKFFGKIFIEGFILLKLLAIGQTINVATGSVGYLLTMTGNEKIALIVTLINTIIFFLLNIFLIPKYHALGAAISTSATIILQNIMLTICVKFKLNILTFPVLKYNSI